MNDEPHRSLRDQRAALLDIPFPDPLNEAAGRARRHTLDWLTSFGLLSGAAATEEYDALRLERLMAYFYPEAAPEDLELATDLNGWFFVFDDQFDTKLGRRPERIAPLVDALLCALDDASTVTTVRAGPLAAAFRDVWVRATAGMPEHWRLRFREHWREYLCAYEWEALHRTSEATPTLADFLAKRRHSIGVQPCLDLAERCGGRTVPDALHGALPVAVLRELTADVVLFVNDLVSLEKELAADDVNNSVLVLRARAGCSLEEAVRRVARLANARVARFRQLEAALPDFLTAEAAPPEVRHGVERYTEAMRRLMRGNLSWSLETPRYADTGAGAVAHGRPRPWTGLL
ncbi:isoafricanol synthase [Streptomyces sp. NPDC048172]|uniref:isoafricanol synthase n=1 Tax=Streptomyces sp. NPDC048172 TaxID=3365505 RepID=UPI00372196B9